METLQAYENLEKAVSYGFITSNFKIGTTNIVLKNVSDKEYRILELLRNSNDKSVNFLYDLAFCTVFIDGRNFLEDRYRDIRTLMDFYIQLPGIFVDKLQKAVADINREYISSLEYLEGFLYTDKSRYMWKFLDLNNRDKYWGVPGLCNVGMNSVQENWVIVNKSLDDEEDYNRDFNLSLIVASATNGKGAQDMSKNHEARRKELSELRDEIAKYGYDKKREKEERKAADGWSAPMRSREDLVKELYRQMSGDKDKHDIYIDTWIQQQKDKAEEAKRLVEEKQKEFRENFDKVGPSFIEGSRPVSAEEMRKIFDKQNNKDLEVSQYISSVESLDKDDRFIKKVSSTVIRPNIDKD